MQYDEQQMPEEVVQPADEGDAVPGGAYPGPTAAFSEGCLPIGRSNRINSRLPRRVLGAQPLQVCTATECE